MREHGNVRPPKELQSAGIPIVRARLGKGKGYVYPHEDPRGFDFDHLPPELRGRTYYQPSGSGEERDE